jgi:membrane protein
LIVRTVTSAVRGYSVHSCSTIAAAISYHVLFSIFPLAVLLVSVLGLVLQDDHLRKETTGALVDALPLTQGADADLAKALDGIAAPTSAVGLISLAGLLWSASGMMGSIRTGLNAAWGLSRGHAFLRGKLVEALMLTAVGLLVLLSVAATVFEQIVSRLGDRVPAIVRDLFSASSPTGAVVGGVVALVLSFLLFVAVYRFVPAVAPPLRRVVLAALFAAVGFELLKRGFAIYLAHFADYNVVYGSLGAVIAFLFFVYLAASVLLFGGELGAASKGSEPGPVDRAASACR